MTGPLRQTRETKKDLHSDDSELPDNLMRTSTDCGGEPEHLERTDAETGGTCKLHKERLRVGIHPTAHLL